MGLPNTAEDLLLNPETGPWCCTMVLYPAPRSFNVFISYLKQVFDPPSHMTIVGKQLFDLRSTITTSCRSVRS